MATILKTPRILLRPWRREDYAPYAALNADPEVRRYWPSTLTREESDEQADHLRRHIEQHDFGFWAAEAPGVAPFVGFIGIKPVEPDLPFAPAIEIGWRLAREYWGRGYATEGARAVLADGFQRLGLREIVAYAVAENMASRRVMERVGMTRNPAEDFEATHRDPGEPHRFHVVYRKRAEMS
jgi:RimJ/RimL family protein N-acetyltransferase